MLLFNGGAMTPASLRQRVRDQIAAWQPDAGAPEELSSRTPELAVAQGAAHYGLVRRGLGARIGGGTPRSFYVGVAGSDARIDRAVCLAPRGLEEGSAVTLPRDFQLTTNRPVSFKLFASTTRDDRPGAVVPLTTVTSAVPGSADDTLDLIELPPIVTVLRAPGRSQVTVQLQVRVTELGALEIGCIEPGSPPPDGRPPWRLSFDVRAGAGVPEADAPTDEAAGCRGRRSPAGSGPRAARPRLQGPDSTTPWRAC